MGIGEVYKKRGVYRKEDRKMQVSRKKKKKKVLNRNKENIKRRA